MDATAALDEYLSVQTGPPQSMPARILYPAVLKALESGSTRSISPYLPNRQCKLRRLHRAQQNNENVNRNAPASHSPSPADSPAVTPMTLPLKSPRPPSFSPQSHKQFLSANHSVAPTPRSRAHDAIAPSEQTFQPTQQTLQSAPERR